MTYHNDADVNDSFSVVEDLDPEPGQGRGLGGKREMWLGGALLAVVVLFAVWQWLRQDYQAGRYRAGQEAIGENNWDAASIYFAQASGYNDADVLAKNSQQMVEQRDRLYKSANEHIDKSEWLQALSDIRALGRIQPSYKDMEVREKLATEKVYDDALSGTVVMRTAANPPGLYYRTPTAWVWLEGSDRNSIWLANERADHIVFDVASDRSTATPTPTPTPDSSAIPNGFIGRSLVDAQVSETKLSFSRLAVDPGVYPPIFVGSDGMWAVNSDRYREYAAFVFPFVRNNFWGSELEYQPYGSDISAKVELTASVTYTEGTVLVFVDPNSNRYLMAHWTNGQSYGPNKDTVIDLYAGAAGEEQTLVYTHKGGRLESAQLSPDGRYMVVTTQAEFKQSVDVIVTSLLDLEGTAPPRILKEAFRYSGSGDLLTLNSAFVSKGVYAGKLVLAEYGSSGTQISVIDPALATGGAQAFYTLSTTTIPGDIETSWYLAEQDAQGVVVAAKIYNYSVFGLSPATSTIHLLVLPASGLPETYSVVMQEPTSELPRISVSGSTITLNVHKTAARQGEEEVFTLYELARSSNARGTQPVKEIFSTKQAGVDEHYGLQTTLHLGRTLIAYTHNGELHARTWDGQNDLILEAGTPAIYENYAFVYYNYLLR